MNTIQQFARRRIFWKLALRWVIPFTLALAGAAPSLAGTDENAGARDKNSSYLPRHTPRFNRVRPVVAVVGYNASTELTDYVVPYGILAESGVADVTAVSTGTGPVDHWGQIPNPMFAARLCVIAVAG